ncbi:MAG: class I SAM-dependent methyltransferase [Candidatus Hodarchaeota archaeon]
MYLIVFDRSHRQDFLPVSNSSQKEILSEYLQSNKYGRIIFPVLGHNDALPIADCHVDASLFTLGLHEEPNPETVIKEMYRITKEGGKVVITDFMTTDHLLITTLQKFLPGHERIGFTVNELELLITGAQLTIEKINIEEGVIVVVAVK